MMMKLLEAVARLVVRDRPSISDSNLAPVVQIVSWLLLGFVLLSMGTRIVTAWARPERAFGLDDGFATAATLLFIAQTICVLMATNAGLAQSARGQSENQLAKALKLEYGADILAIVSLGASKLSIVLFLLIITPVGSHQKMLWATGALVGAWVAIGTVGTAFECAPPDRWDYVHGACFDRLAFLQFVAVFNILTEVPLIVLPLLIAMPLKTSFSRRLRVMVCFGARILNIGAVIGQLLEIAAFVRAPDPVLQVWSYQVCVQCVEALSIITACIPYLRSLLESFQAGALRADDAAMRRLNERSTAHDTSHPTRRAHLEADYEARLKTQRDGSIDEMEISSTNHPRVW